MNIFETIREDKNGQAKSDQNLADKAVAEVREKIKDQILFLKLNSKDENVRHHLQPINEENKRNLLDSIPNIDIIDFNEVVLKGNWKEYMERFEGEKKTKFDKEETLKENPSLEKKGYYEGTIPAEKFPLSFRAMINHYAKNLEIEEKEKKVLSEREELKKKFGEQLSVLEKQKPHIVAEIKDMDFNILRRPDYEVFINLDKNNFQSYEEKLKSYFQLKAGSTTEARPDDIKAEIIRQDPRFRYYCALRELLDLEGRCSPEIFYK